MAKRKRSNNDGFFGFGSNDFGIDRAVKSTRLEANKRGGKLAEDSFEFGQRIQGHDVRRIHKGGDFVVQKRDFFGNKVGKPTTHEIKTGNSQLSEAQKRAKARLGKRYKVERYY